MVGFGASCSASHTQLIAPITANTREQEAGRVHVCGTGQTIPGGEDVSRREDPVARSRALGIGGQSGRADFRGGAGGSGGRNKAQ